MKSIYADGTPKPEVEWHSNTFIMIALILLVAFTIGTAAYYYDQWAHPDQYCKDIRERYKGQESMMAGRCFPVNATMRVG